jgi:hypothetical protein
MVNYQKMESKNHISDILNNKLNLIGSKIILNSGTNDIGEQIASKLCHDRTIEVIKLENEIWISFYYKNLILGSKTTENIDEITQSIHYFLDHQIELKKFYNSEFGIQPPFQFSKACNDEQIIFELKWFYLLEPEISDYPEPKEWLIIKQFVKKIEKLSCSKFLTPYRSLNRICFELGNDPLLGNLPCLWSSIRKDGTEEYSIADINGNSLKSGSEKEILAEYEKRVKSCLKYSI